MFAQSIHNHSPRKKASFIPVNCAAIPENLLEGILFGTSRGSFTGAIDPSGQTASGHSGKKVRKLGSLKEIDLDVKIISSVGQLPLKNVQNGSLRMDLFYRMGVVSIMLPPLRERQGDLEILLQHFISRYNQTQVDQAYSPESAPNLMETQKSREQEMILNALARSRGNAARAARSLGISPQSFHYKMKKFGIDRKAFV